jgi:hypothetical protein
MAYDSVQIKLLLVINGHKEEWLAPLNEALTSKLRNPMKIWSFKVIVINEKMAQSYNLIN